MFFALGLLPRLDASDPEKTRPARLRSPVRGVREQYLQILCMTVCGPKPNSASAKTTSAFARPADVTSGARPGQQVIRSGSELGSKRLEAACRIAMKLDRSQGRRCPCFEYWSDRKTPRSLRVKPRCLSLPLPPRDQRQRTVLRETTGRLKYSQP